MTEWTKMNYLTIFEKQCLRLKAELALKIKQILLFQNAYSTKSQKIYQYSQNL